MTNLKVVLVRYQAERDSELKRDRAAAERCHMCMMIKMSDLFGFVNDLKNKYYYKFTTESRTRMNTNIDLMLMLEPELMMLI